MNTKNENTLTKKFIWPHTFDTVLIVVIAGVLGYIAYAKFLA